jgi:hypothetical protein
MKLKNSNQLFIMNAIQNRINFVKVLTVHFMTLWKCAKNGIVSVFFKFTHNDRGYGHWRFAGEFPVVKRQGKCGRKTR